MADHRQRDGALAEWLVATLLRLGGWSIVGRRLRVGGVEVDIVARRRSILALVEVKARRRMAHGPHLLVGARQRRRLERAARVLAASQGEPVLVRTDLAEVTWAPLPRVRFHPAAWGDGACSP